MHAQRIHSVVTGLFISSLCAISGCSSHGGPEDETAPQSAELQGDDGAGATPLSALANTAATECNDLVRQANDGTRYIRLGEPLPDFTTFSGGVIQDGIYELTEDSYYPPYPQGMDPVGTSWATLRVTGNVLSAIVTDHRGGEREFNAVIVRNGAQISLTALCGLDATESSEWHDLKFPFIRSGYTVDNDRLIIGWMNGNHAATVKIFHRLDPSQTW